MDDQELLAFLDDSNHIEDCLDYFATVLLHRFSDLQLERFEATEWRQGWRISLPPQTRYSLGDVEELVIPLRDMLFWKKDILIPYMLIPFDSKVEE